MALERRRRALGVDISDVLGLCGAAALEYGLALWWAPAAWMVGGVLLLALAIGPDLRRRHGAA